MNLDRVSHGCGAWRFIDDAPRAPRAPRDSYIIPQTDGNYTLPSRSSYKDYDEPFTDSEEGPDILGSVHSTGLDLIFNAPTVQQAATDPSQGGPLQQLFSRIVARLQRPFRRKVISSVRVLF